MLDSDNDIGIDDDSLQVGYRRPELIPCDNLDLDYELSDRIKLRLALARSKALEVHKRKWG
jgi:hypothetical protein